MKTDGLITSELILIGDYRTLGLSNPRIIDTLPPIIIQSVYTAIIGMAFLATRKPSFRIYIKVPYSVPFAIREGGLTIIELELELELWTFLIV